MSYDIVIHCNILNCRKDIYHEEKACVTSCSHIFCLDCANVKFGEALVCPACESALTRKNDIILIQLSPSEEYKSSVLAGLSPAVIMDICNRALSFYNYQVSQELYYREALQQSLQAHSDKRQTHLQAESMEINRLLQVEKDKTQALVKENELEKRRSHDLQSEIHSKSIQFTKLQKMYEKLKNKSMGSRVQQSVQDNSSYFSPITDISNISKNNNNNNKNKNNNNNNAQFQVPSYLNPQQPTTPHKLRQPSGYHSRQHQEWTNMTGNTTNSTRHEISAHRGQQDAPLSTIGFRSNKMPPRLHHSKCRPAASVIDLGSKKQTTMRQRGRISQQSNRWR